MHRLYMGLPYTTYTGCLIAAFPTADLMSSFFAPPVWQCSDVQGVVRDLEPSTLGPQLDLGDLARV